MSKNILLKNTPNCIICADGGLLFKCETWKQSEGTCCPDGTTQKGCPGKTVLCSCDAGKTILRNKGLTSEFAIVKTCKGALKENLIPA